MPLRINTIKENQGLRQLRPFLDEQIHKAEGPAVN